MTGDRNREINVWRLVFSLHNYIVQIINHYDIEDEQYEGFKLRTSSSTTDRFSGARFIDYVPTYLIM